MAVTIDSTTLTYSDSSAQTTAFSSSVNRGSLLNVSVFMASGTWTKPAGCTYVVVKLVGGGGGGCGYCEAGGAGGYAEGTYDVTAVSTVSVTVGGGGAGTGYYTASGNGGTTNFGSYISATGGYGANNNYSHSGGHGGVGSGGQVNLYGSSGIGHCNSVGSHNGGYGGASYFGGSGQMIRNHGNNNSVYLGKLKNGASGSGGPGAQSNGDQTGGNSGAYGEAGLVIVYAYS